MKNPIIRYSLATLILISALIGILALFCGLAYCIKNHPTRTFVTIGVCIALMFASFGVMTIADSLKPKQ